MPRSDKNAHSSGRFHSRVFVTDLARRHVQSARSPSREITTEIGSIRLFRQLPQTTIEGIATRGKVQRFRQGSFLFLEGSPADYVHFLLSGQIKIVHETDGGQEVILRLIQPGEFFGGAGGWGAQSYPASAVALDDIRVFRISVEEFATLIGRYPDFALAVIQEMGIRLREAEARIRELQAERVERRIARTLLRLANKTGHKTDRGIQIDLPQSRQHLAELSGATLSTVSRVLSEWDRQGLILAGRERVTLVKPHDLVTIAEDTPPAGDW